MCLSPVPPPNGGLFLLPRASLSRRCARHVPRAQLSNYALATLGQCRGGIRRLVPSLLICLPYPTVGRGVDATIWFMGVHIATALVVCCVFCATARVKPFTTSRFLHSTE
jgi:hypothetical protein